MTEKLYDLNSYLTEFDAEVVSCDHSVSSCFKDTIKSIIGTLPEKNEFYEMILNRTAFFPEGGGQSSDIGNINGFNVYDVRSRNDEIVHLIGIPVSENADTIFKPGTNIRGHINWNKRFERMQQHSGEHLLSGFVFKQFGYHNTGFHLSDNGTTVDFDGTFTEDDLILIENTVNDIILKNVPSHIYYPLPEELKKLTYRSKKELEGPVRIVEFCGSEHVRSNDPVLFGSNNILKESSNAFENENISDICDVYDRCACCAPHVASTIEIGLFKILSAEHFKGGTRMEIACGQRLLNEMRIMQHNIRSISQLLSVKPENTADGVMKLNDSYKTLKFNNIRIERELLEMAAANADKPILFFDSADTGNVRIAVNSLTGRFPESFCCAFVGNDEKGYNYIIACRQDPEDLPLDCAVLLGQMKSNLKASGGGSSSMIQGNIKATKTDIEDFLSTLSHV
ncbi:MAG: alanyl-tRNA editing protein [Lachnospiraceae bacterium]|nr:alanyl-tRNA editing protein [Lachnospiraceae bacterium]